METKIEEAYRLCDELTRREGKNFSWGFRFLPADRRRAMNALYAFARRTDDIVDEESMPIAVRAEHIRAWRDQTRAALAGADDGLFILVALADAARRFAIPADELMLLIEGCEDDLTVTRYATMPETLGYCRKVAVTVGMCMLPIFGARDSRMVRAMESIGYAFQLTNILRDVPEDLARERIYLPRDLMDAHGVTEVDLRDGRLRPEVSAMMMEAATLAKEYYAAAVPLYYCLPRPAAKSMKVMGRIYEGILDVIIARRGDVWSARPSLSTFRKCMIAMGSML